VIAEQMSDIVNKPWGFCNTLRQSAWAAFESTPFTPAESSAA